MGVDIRSEKNLGLIGSILSIVSGFVGVVPYVGAFGGSLSLVGFILILVALHGIGNKLGDDRPFRYYLYSVIVAVAGIIIAVILVIFVIFGTLAVFPPAEFDHGFPVAGVGIILMAFLGLIAILIVSTYFAKQAWEAMYEITGVKEFHETARWLWWGALTAIILVGFILLLVAAIFQIIAFANLPEEIEERPAAEPAL